MVEKIKTKGSKEIGQTIQSLATATNSYSPKLIGSYDMERHMPLADAFDLVKSQPHLERERFTSAIASGNLHVYKFKGAEYVDRLDVGRMFYESLPQREGLTIKRSFTDGKTSPYDVPYEKHTLHLPDKKGKTIFHMDNAEFPEGWDTNAATVVGKIYFYRPNEPELQDTLQEKIGRDHEYSLRHLVTRVTNFFADEGWRLGYFKTEEDREAFRDELAYLQMKRMVAFNTPVQINAGLYNEYGIRGSTKKVFWRNPETGNVELITREFEKPQTHACFIKGPRDDLESILEHFKHEGAIFSNGSGIGLNIGTLRGAEEPLSGGGVASGAMTFLEMYDRNAGTIKSGGKSRRAARMTEIRQDHPDVMEFIRRKPDEDNKALVLIQNGWSPGMDGEAYMTVAFQNTNLSVQLNDYFFEQLKKGGNIEFKRVVDGKVVGSISAERMLKEIAFGSWRIGDPAVQFESEMQRMHTCNHSGRINSTNPCSEYVFLNDTSCNLASLNLLAFSDAKGNFDVQSFVEAARVTTIAQDIINDAAGYPIEDIAMISPEFRTIGLGYANLGTLLMRRGTPYDSEEGRAFAAAITAAMTGVAYETSTEMAEGLGTFVQYAFNKQPMQEVIGVHKKNLDEIIWDTVPKDLKETAYKSWKNVVKRGKKFGFRNAQATVLAPTGTISSLMGCDSTGVEPVISHIINKDLAGGGTLKLVNNEVENALHNLGYSDIQIKDIAAYMTKEIAPDVARGIVRGAPHIRPEHYAIFDTAFGNSEGVGSIAFQGHVRMLGATQPFISGAISKTNNLPEQATVKDIYDGYLLAQDLKLKAIAVFRNNSKPATAVNFGARDFKKLERGEKEDLPERRQAYENEFTINGIPFHIITSEYADGRPGQITFLSFRGGSTLGTMLATSGVQASKALKRGEHLEDIAEGWLGQRMEEFAGVVKGHPYIKMANSPLDFAAKWLLLEYMGKKDVATEPEKVDVHTLRGFQNGAMRTYRRMKVNEWDVDQVLKDPELGGFVKASEEELGLASHSTSVTNARGVLCNVCGFMMRQTAPNCFICENPSCRNKEGGCGI